MSTQNKIQNLQGSIVAIVTPFLEDGTVDFESYDRLVDFHLENGTNGIVVCGTTGETPTLSEEEYVQLIRRTVERVNGRIPVIAGSGSNSTSHSINLSQLAMEQGVDGLLVVGPYYNKPTTEGFYLHFAEIAKTVDVPIILYNVPGRTGKNIPTSVVIRLAKEFKNIVGVKEASGDFNQIMDVIAQRPEGFRVYSGDDSFALNVIALGGDGCISVAANEFPKEFSDLVRLALHGDFAAARTIHYRYLHLMNLNFIESNPIPVKTALALMGMVKEVFHLPMCPMEDANREKLRAELEVLGLL